MSKKTDKLSGDIVACVSGTPGYTLEEIAKKLNRKKLEPVDAAIGILCIQGTLSCRWVYSDTGERRKVYRC